MVTEQALLSPCSFSVKWGVGGAQSPRLPGETSVCLRHTPGLYCLSASHPQLQRCPPSGRMLGLGHTVSPTGCTVRQWPHSWLPRHLLIPQTVLVSALCVAQSQIQIIKQSPAWQGGRGNHGPCVAHTRPSAGVGTLTYPRHLPHVLHLLFPRSEWVNIEEPSECPLAGDSSPP